MDAAELPVIDPGDKQIIRIVDQDGVVLAYRMPVPDRFIQMLEATTPLLDAHAGRVMRHERGETELRHYTCWSLQSDGRQNPYMNMDYQRHQPESVSWANANMPLFGWLSGEVLRNVNPDMYATWEDAWQYLPETCEPVCGSWLGCAVSRHQKGSGVTHLDVSDTPYGLNAIVPYGEFQSSNLALFELGLRMPMPKGYGLLFTGRLLTHQAVDIIGPDRCFVDMFSHRAVLEWCQRRKALGAMLRPRPLGRSRRVEGKRGRQNEHVPLVLAATAEERARIQNEALDEECLDATELA